MGRTIIKFTGHKGDDEESNSSPAEKALVTTAEEALLQVRGGTAEIVDDKYLQHYFAESFPHMSASEAEKCATMYSSLHGDATELSSKNLVFEEWKR